MKKIKYFLLGLLGLIAALLVYGLIEPYIIDKEPQVAVIPGLPAAWQGQRIAVIGDWQVGMWLGNTPTIRVGMWLGNTPTIRRIVTQLVKERPSAVLIIGDFIYSAGDDPSAEINQAIELVRPLTAAGIPTYAVLGNHDYGMKSKNGSPDVAQATKLAESLESVGVQVLQNEAVPLVSSTKLDKQAILYLVGIGSQWADRDKPQV